MAHIVSAVLQGAGVELLYSFVIIVCSLMIYYSTKEMYELSSYTGIKYFRQAFLLFAGAYFFKSFIKIILVYFGVSRIVDIDLRFMGFATVFLFMFCGSLAVFYLVYSLMWKKWNKKSSLILGIFYILSIAISFLTITTMEIWVFLVVNIFILAVAIFGLYIIHKQSGNKKKNSSMQVIYTLLFIFWILNIIEVLVPILLQLYQMLLYMASLGIFLIILYKVLKKSGSN